MTRCCAAAGASPVGVFAGAVGQHSAGQGCLQDRCACAPPPNSVLREERSGRRYLRGGKRAFTSLDPAAGTKRWVTPTLSLTERGSERVAFTEVAYRKDSRIEIIVGDARDAGCQMQPDTRHHNPYHGACGREDSGSSGNSLLAAEAAGSALLELSLSVHDITAAARSTAWDDVERQLLRLLKVAAV